MSLAPWKPGQRVWWFERRVQANKESVLVRVFGVVRAVHETTASVRIHVPIEKASFLEPERSQIVQKRLDRLNRVGSNLKDWGSDDL